MKKKSTYKNFVILFICLFLLITYNTIVLSSKNNTADPSRDNHRQYKLHRLPLDYTKKSPSKEHWEINILQNPVQNNPINLGALDGGPMDSAWPMYSQNMKHTGRSPNNTSNNLMTEQWRYPLRGYTSYCSPILDKNSTIYVGRENFYAIYPNGSLKWQQNYTAWIEGNPAIDEQGIIYYGTTMDTYNYLYARYSTNGSIKWKYLTGNHADSSPAIGNDNIIYFGDWNGNIHAVYQNGTRKWMYHTDDVITSSPAIGNDGIIYIGSHDDNVYAIYPNGTLKWKFPTGSWIHASPTIGADGTIYIGSDDNYLYAIYPNNGTMIWKCAVGSTWCSPTLGPDGTLYLGTWQMSFHAINPNGTVKWTYQAPGRIWFGQSAALSNDGILYFGTTWMDGGVEAFISLYASNGTERFRDPYGRYETSPIIAPDGTIYAVSAHGDGSSGLLRVFSNGEPKKIEIKQPHIGDIYIFDHKIVTTSKEFAIAIGSITVEVQAYSTQELHNVSFYIDNNLQFADSEPPFEWKMNRRYGEKILEGHKLTVIGWYKGGCSWVETMNIAYIHFLKNLC
jgi:outer membrane protein assembly factor BamB